MRSLYYPCLKIRNASIYIFASGTVKLTQCKIELLKLTQSATIDENNFKIAVPLHRRLWGTSTLGHNIGGIM
jgi:hypothetical protein